MAMMQNASATRLENPLNHFLNQVYTPWLYMLDRLIKRHVGTQQIKDIIGDKLGAEYVLDMKQYHASVFQFEELLGARMSVKKNIAQSLMMLTQMFQNPALIGEMAKVGSKVNIRPIIRLWLEASEVGSGIENDIFTDMSPEEKQAYEQQQQGSSAMAQKMQMLEAQTQAKSQLESQHADSRLREKLTEKAAEASSMDELIKGEPNPQGFGA